MRFAKFNSNNHRTELIYQDNVYKANILFCSCFRMNRILMGQGRAEAWKYEWMEPPNPQAIHSCPDPGWMESLSRIEDGSHKHRQQKEQPSRN